MTDSAVPEHLRRFPIHSMQPWIGKDRQIGSRYRDERHNKGYTTSSLAFPVEIVSIRIWCARRTDRR